MYEKINYTLVGFFVIIFFTLISFFGFWLAKSNMSIKNFNRYYIIFSESVDGLNKDSVVKLNGVNVGRLEELSIKKDEPYKVIAKILIRKDIKITKDMYAVLSNLGVTGLKFINIIGGKSKEIIKPNRITSIINAKSSFIANLTEKTPKLISKLNLLTDNISKITSNKNIESINHILANGVNITNKAIKIEDKLITTLNKLNEQDISKIIKDLNKTVISTLLDYKKLAKNSNKSLKFLNNNLPKLVTNLNSSLKSINRASITLQKSINRGDYNLKRILKPAIVDLKELSIKYNELADELTSMAQDPSGTIFNAKSLPKGPGE